MAQNKLYVGGLAYAMNDQDLEGAFAPYGKVLSAQIIMDRMSGRSKGFGFVEFETDAEAQAAIEGLHEQEVNGRKIIVNVARPREERPPRKDFGGSGY